MKIVGQRPEPGPKIWKNDDIWRGVRLGCEACGAILEMEGWRDFQSTVRYDNPVVSRFGEGDVSIRVLVPCLRCHQTIEVIRTVAKDGVQEVGA